MRSTVLRELVFLGGKVETFPISAKRLTHSTFPFPFRLLFLFILKSSPNLCPKKLSKRGYCKINPVLVLLVFQTH